ncbi:MAG: hypothetical protein A2847_00835 [Candidatus Sungbacteria bacterium RIFCSPHIGHO2_01_FULL_50_25]|uniref:FAD/NAD(P)-binding domain-containing protein n=1 Tax=Candidatus Sungbacteria bacterium RIFCSPHIGHO2_01_FULL_50_25 TaxID=1802265 RepID=A0A1G2KB11_9BACT|nr:MAG: hypothetical protein A2847_00835 [Candidatus Sungbacteria bacterium RIFCSPHIGHO2_01_FULL_50_25]
MRDSYTYLIIGGGIAGVGAAEAIRSRDRDGTIAILSAEPYRLYSRVLLPRYVRGEIERDRMFLRKEGDYQKERIDFLPNTKVLFVNTEKAEVGLSDHKTIGYKKLLIASGGDIAPSNLDGYDEYVYRLQTLDDADRLRERFRAKKFEFPIVIGGSFIALEFLSLCAAYNVKARVLFRSKHFFSRIAGPHGGEFMRRLFMDHGFEVIAEDEVEDAAEGEGYLHITTRRLGAYDHDAVFSAVGLKRNSDFLAGTKVELGTGVKTNEFLETAAPAVFAAGDVAEYFDPLFEKHRIVGNWANAFLQGKLAGLNMTGDHLALRVVSSYSTTHFGHAISALGDCSDTDGSFEKADFQKSTYERYFFQKDRLIGAVLINRNDVRAHAARLIETRSPLGEYRRAFGHAAFDIHKIPVVESI